MQLLRFLLSRLFLKQLGYTVVFLGLVFILVSWGLKVFTRHNEYQKVPNLRGLTLAEVSQKVAEEKLRYEVIDSTKFNASLPPFTVISQFPEADSEVKINRKLYLTINPSGYRKITVPNIIQITRRNAEAMIHSVGFEVGEITYQNNIGKDMVLEIKHQGETIKPGILLPRMSTIDLILGNGNR